MQPNFYLSGTYKKQDCPIALLEYKDYVMENYIKLNDYLDSINENKEREFEKLDYIHRSGTYKNTLVTGVYNSDNGYVFPVWENYDYPFFYWRDILITDKVSPYLSEYPLFYQHRLQYDLYSEYGNPENNIKIHKNGTELVDQKTYMLEYGNCSIDASGNPFLSYYYDPSLIYTWSKIKPTGVNFRTRVLLPYTPDYDNYYDIEYDAYIKGSVIKRKELINRKPIYAQNNHYSFTTSGIQLSNSSSLLQKIKPSGYLYLQKTYDSRIFFKDFDTVVKSSGNSNWNLTLNPGKFVVTSGIFYSDNTVYNIPKIYENYIISGEHPTIINQNVIKTTKFPLVVTASGYPSYRVLDGLNLRINGELLESGYIQSLDEEKGFIQLNRNLNKTDLVDIDYTVSYANNFPIRNLDLNPKNFNQFCLPNDNVSLAITPMGDDMSLAYYFQVGENFGSDTMPIMSQTYSFNVVPGKNYHISGLMCVSQGILDYGYGIYLTVSNMDILNDVNGSSIDLFDDTPPVEIDEEIHSLLIDINGITTSNILSITLFAWSYYFFGPQFARWGTDEYTGVEIWTDELDNSNPSGIIFFRTSENQKANFTQDTYGWDGSLVATEYISGIIDTNAKLIADITYKSTPKDIIDITDCRRLGGGLDTNLDSKESDWYSDRGKWDGEILQSNSAIMIQIPSGVINYFIEKFSTNGTFTEENYNEQILLGTDPSGVLSELGFSDLKYYNAVKSANRYIIDTVERYLPVGTEYILCDENQNLLNLML